MANGTAILRLAQRVLACEKSNYPVLRERMVEFENALLPLADAEDDGLVRDLAPLFPQLNEAYESFETELEFEFAKNVLQSRFEPAKYLLHDRFVTLVSNEVRMAELQRGDHVVMIGSGPFPITAILLHTKFGIHVTAVDGDHGAVELSRQVIKRLGLESGISVECESGESFVPSVFSSVIVALLAQPKELILQNIFTHYDRRAKVVCRTSHGVRQALYRATDPSAFSTLKQIASQRAVGDQTISSILLR